MKSTFDRNRRLRVEPLENRDVPATFGIPWSDPTHLTISFPADGTVAEGLTSNLKSALDGQMPTAVWRGTILRAAQTWAQAANLSIGVVSDSNDPFGTAGETQGDPRFGDIRIGGFEMAGDALGEAIPPDPLLTGTLAGDVFFNTAAVFTEKQLYTVALHEIGHALGMAPSALRRSVMFNQFSGGTALIPADVIGLRAMYGPRVADESEGRHGNASFKRASRIEYPSGFDGTTPLFAFGTLATRSDVDIFELRNERVDNGPVTIRVQSSGISLIAPRLSVFDSRGKLVTQLSATAAEGSTISYTLAAMTDERGYFLRVDAAPGSTNRIGRYGFAITFDRRLQSGALSIDHVLRGPYESLDQTDLSELYVDPTSALYQEDAGANDSVANAEDLEGVYGPLALGRFTTTGSIGTATDVDYYRIRAPRHGPRIELTLIATVRAIGPNGAVPTLEVFDRDENAMQSEVLVNDEGTLTVQILGAESGRQYYLKLSGGEAGNYSLEAAFRSKRVELESFATGTVNQGQPAGYKLYAGRTQLFGFTLAATGTQGGAALMTMRNQTGDVVMTLVAEVGQTVSGLSALLAPGEYTVEVSAIGSSGPIGFSIAGTVVTDPLGPRPGNTTLAPKYQDPSKPGGYLYPGGLTSVNPYLWVFLLS
jgi:predicted Zn-dependent protease